MKYPIGMMGKSLLGVLALLVIQMPWSPSGLRLVSRQIVYNVTRRASNVCVGHNTGEFVFNPDDCSKFYYCLEDGEGAEAECPHGMLFNKESKLCDQESNVVCQTSGDPDQSNSHQNNNNNDNNEVASVARYCAGQALQQNGRIEYVRSRGSCRHYYICYYGQAILQECSANLHWNPNTKKCDFPAAAGCNGSQNGSPTDVVGNLIQCPPFGEHIYPHMRRCDYFVYCVKGHAVLQQCPFYNEFDIDTKTCKSRNIARCVTDLLR